MTVSRNRGSVFLDPILVKFYANKIGISGFGTFAQEVFKKNPTLNPKSKVLERAWNGCDQPMDNRFAGYIARALHLENYEYLVLGNSFPAAWKSLITNNKYQKQFLTFRDHSCSDLYLVNFANDDNKDLQEVSLSVKWHLELLGHKGEAVFIILQSESVFYQLAPVEKAGHNSEFKVARMRYPEKEAFTFNTSDGLGWRQIIVIKAKFLPHSINDRYVGYKRSIDELNLFASRLLDIKNNTLCIDKFEFKIVNADDKN